MNLKPSASSGQIFPARRRERGQVLVIFVVAMMLFMMLMAMVADMGWYWASGLRVQRAADAAALAGSVYLPDDYPSANTAALAAAKRNGYVPDAGTTITTIQDAQNDRQLDVTITTKVNTFFLKVVGISSLGATRSSKAEFVLPVPMGSPQNYYGVGTFLSLVTPTTITPYTNASDPSNTGAGAWTNPGNAYKNNKYATEATNNDAQVWNGFNFGNFQSGVIIDGLTLALTLKDSSLATGSASCQVRAEVSWNGGSSWGNLPQTTSPSLTKSDVAYTLGSQTDDSVWGSNHAIWSTNDFSGSNFAIRLTYLKGAGCGTVSLGNIAATVYSHTAKAGTSTETVASINDPNGKALASQGAWGAVITKGGSRENGDQFGPANDNLRGRSNPDFNGQGVDYTVIINGSNGQVQLFDPSFCETGVSSGSGNYGAGDHWIAGNPNPVTTIYSLYNQNGTPYDTSDDTLVTASGDLFAGQVQADYSGAMGTPAHSGLTNCANDSYHNKWWRLASGLPADTYRLNVSTNVSGNNSTNAENMWSLWVSSSGGTSQVYGQGKMVTYANLTSGQQLFYLAQIDDIHAGKTMEIHLFDPGDVNGNASLRILSPDGNAYRYVNFSYTADNGASGSNVSSIQTAAGGVSYFNDALITIAVPLPATYGSVGLTPPGEPSAGWWKIEYTVNGGNDTATWAVDIRGNPVHLLAP